MQLHDPGITTTPSQRLAATARTVRLAKIALQARPDCGITLHRPRPVETLPAIPLVRSEESWVERQKRIPIPKKQWFSVVADLGSVDRRPQIEDIIKAVALHYGVSRNDIISERRTARVVLPRQIAVYLARLLTLRGLPFIGRCFGRDHTTALHAFRKIERLVQSDAVLAAEIDEIKRGILG